MKDETKYANFVAAVQETQRGKNPKLLVHPDHEAKFMAWLRQFCEPSTPNIHPSYLGVKIITSRAAEPGQILLVSERRDGSGLDITTISGLEVQQ